MTCTLEKKILKNELIFYNFLFSHKVSLWRNVFVIKKTEEGAEKNEKKWRRRDVKADPQSWGIFLSNSCWEVDMRVKNVSQADKMFHNDSLYLGMADYKLYTAKKNFTALIYGCMNFLFSNLKIFSLKILYWYEGLVENDPKCFWIFLNALRIFRNYPIWIFSYYYKYLCLHNQFNVGAI